MQLESGIILTSSWRSIKIIMIAYIFYIRSKHPNLKKA